MHIHVSGGLVGVEQLRPLRQVPGSEERLWIYWGPGWVADKVAGVGERDAESFDDRVEIPVKED